MKRSAVYKQYYENLTAQQMLARLTAGYLTSSGYLESIQLRRAVRDSMSIPWLTYPAIKFLESEISKQTKVFEYGGGDSTIYWNNKCGLTITVEHDEGYASYLTEQSYLRPERIHLLQEGARVRDNLQRLQLDLPAVTDPTINEMTLRSGQINHGFEAYVLEIFDVGEISFDLIVVDGMARVWSTWAAVRNVDPYGLIVFDNSDRSCYEQAYSVLREEGFNRIDFWGLGPINPYEWCTSVFYRSTRNVGRKSSENIKSSVSTASLNRELSSDGVGYVSHGLDGDKECQILSAGPGEDKLGIILVVYNRPLHAQSVLESLRQQESLKDLHVWIDGTHGRGEYLQANDETLQVVKSFGIENIHHCHGHLGVEKLMLDALSFMSERYNRILILEDDCFPVEGAILQFEEGLKNINGNGSIFSVYGSHFGIERSGSQDFGRFQGWGWAAWSTSIRRYLPALKALFLMTEDEYREYTSKALTPELKLRLEITPGRDVTNALSRCFSWDSAICLLCAKDGLSHRRTKDHVIYNTGISEGIGHFRKDIKRFRDPPFKMITLDEAWRFYDQTTLPCDFKKNSYGLNEVDKKILGLIGTDPGFFVELGGYDGVTQSNSVLLEAAGWRGLLVEPIPSAFAKCVKSRPNCLVVNAACVPRGYSQSTISIQDVGLMSVSSVASFNDSQLEEWISRGESNSKKLRQSLKVPAIPLNDILLSNGITSLDLLLLDVEGAEIQVLMGLDLSKYQPKYIVAEDAYTDTLIKYLRCCGYEILEILTQRKYTRDIIYKRIP